MLFAAFILGLFGSLHCAGMCGPLALALPVVDRTRVGFILGRLLYNIGRIFTYVVIGLIVGTVGQTLALAGFQRWLSISAGALILAGLIFARFSLNAPVGKLVMRVKSTFGTLLKKRSYPALFALGATNGLLPCGLVYVAAAGAATTGQVASAAEYMLLFGIGTLPVMLAIPLLGRGLSLRLPIQKLVPISVAVVAALLIVRGLALGVPYLSPELGPHCSACH